MRWHDIDDPHRGDLDELAGSYALHPLHIEHARTGAQRTKADDGRDYIFVILKLLGFDEGKQLTVADLVHRARFSDYRAQRSGATCRSAAGSGYGAAPGPGAASGDGLHLGSYLPVIEQLEDSAEELDKLVVARPDPAVLEEIGDLRGSLLELRRVLGATRHAAFPLRMFPIP